ncbi:efflux RND transporter periplasmic adaptor subunit [Lacunisphaera limnophila]|uniref:efflux RND transporter periplasmic adaptor subunit n=1 Tax=Lacunisphaera limnophila TaxID=1838286 RepID=UPI001470D750|nr:efflux RND transporter periplasmic adaptor subunit [Lacunisphaera limnophila]
MQAVQRCRQYEGNEEGFWPLFTEALAEATGATHVLLLRRQLEPNEGWKPFSAWPAREKFPLGAPLDDPGLMATLERAVKEELAEFRPPADPKSPLPAVSFDGGMPGWQFTALFRLPAPVPEAGEFARRAARLLDLPVLYRRTRALRQAGESNRAFAQTFDLLTLLDRQTRFTPAVMTVCNELARQTGCSRVSLGWRQDAYVRIRAVSDLPRFEPKMEVVRQLETAMEEACDQDEEIILPEPDDATYVARDHQQFARTQGVAYLATLPLRVDERPVGALLLERQDRAFSAGEITALRVVLDRASRRIDELERHDGSLPRRAARATRAQLAKLLGPEHTWWKAAGALTALLLLLSVVCTWPHRVEGSFVVRSDTLVNLPAPFEGYITEVPVRVGDPVRTGDLLIRLDKRQLLLEQGSLTAELARHEAQRAQAEVERRLAEMRAAAAAKEQAQASLDIVRFRLSRADIVAPADGVVVEGDLRERIGTPVKAGDLLMRVTRIEAMYVEIEVPERDAHAVLASRRGEIAFATLPGERHPIVIDRLEPVARVKPEGNVFVLRARITAPNDRAVWWRPGMSGVAKVEAGDRRILWLLTHRLVDYIRLKLWL